MGRKTMSAQYYTYAQVVKMNLPQFSGSFTNMVETDTSSVVSETMTVCSSSSDELPIEAEVILSKYQNFENPRKLKNFAQNWSDMAKMESFLDGVSSIKIIEQVIEDWVILYSEISFKGIGSDTGKWIFKKFENGGFVYVRRPAASRLRKKNHFYKSIVLNEDSKIVNIL